MCLKALKGRLTRDRKPRGRSRLKLMLAETVVVDHKVYRQDQKR